MALTGTLAILAVDRLSAAEPTTWLLVVVGLLALAAIRRRRV